MAFIFHQDQRVTSGLSSLFLQGLVDVIRLFSLSRGLDAHGAPSTSMSGSVRERNMMGKTHSDWPAVLNLRQNPCRHLDSRFSSRKPLSTIDLFLSSQLVGHHYVHFNSHLDNFSWSCHDCRRIFTRARHATLRNSRGANTLLDVFMPSSNDSPLHLSWEPGAEP